MGYIFAILAGAAMSVQGVINTRLGEKAGVENVHPHRFRRTLATELCRKGMPIQEVARILGHDKIDTSLKYVVLNKEDIKTAYRRYAS